MLGTDQHRTSLLCESGLQPLDHIITDKIVSAAGRMMEKNINADALMQGANADFITLTEQKLPFSHQTHPNR